MNMHPRIGARRLLVAAVLLCTAMAVQAQTQQQPERLAGEVLQCLSRPSGGPAYSERDKEWRTSGQLRVKLVFSRADAAPDVEILSRAGSDDMVDAVRDFVRAYRLPCLPAPQRIELIQSFIFSAQGAVEGSQLHAVPRAESVNLEQCLRTPPRQPYARQEEGLATRLARKPRVSNLIALARFTAVGEAPEITVLHDSMSGRDSTAVLEHLRAYRMSCLPEPQRELAFTQQFTFVPGDVQTMVLKDMGLLQLLRLVKDLGKQRVRMDLSTMACPFQVHWRVGMPIMRNSVREVGAPNLNRLEFLDWLSGLSLDIKPELLEQLLGQSIVVDVPCINISLDPS